MYMCIYAYMYILACFIMFYYVLLCFAKLRDVLLCVAMLCYVCKVAIAAGSYAETEASYNGWPAASYRQPLSTQSSTI